MNLHDNEKISDDDERGNDEYILQFAVKLLQEKHSFLFFAESWIIFRTVNGKYLHETRHFEVKKPRLKS